MAKSCGGCKFWRPIAAGGVNACHFLLDTGIPRCYPPEECIYHTKGMENMSRGKALSPETIGQIEQMNAEGKTIPQISEVLGVSPATVSRVRSGKLKSPETGSTCCHTAPTDTAEEHVTEDITDSGSSADTNIIPDVPEVVKQEESYDTTLLNPTVCGAVLDRINKTDEELAALRRDITLLEKEKKTLEDYLRKYKEAQNNGTR